MKPLQGVYVPCDSYPNFSRLVYQGCKLVGCGSSVPKLQISNDDLAEIFVETSDEWISLRTGIYNRRVLARNESLTDLAVEAANKALDMAQVEPDDVDLVLLCSSTAEDLLGSATQNLIISLSKTCTGGGFRNVLFIAADALSRFVDWSDRGVCILFGDAAGAVMVQACESEEYGLFGFDLHSDGEGKRHLNASIKYVNVEADGALGSNGSATDSPPRRAAAYSTIDMNGKVFHFAARSVPLSIESALEKGWNE
ncbi:hypothetical protein Dimus_034915 [Dionaea muscipula]